MRRGFLGGTFNPPHLGHVRAAAKAAKELGLEALYVIPAGIPPHKELPEGGAAGDQRLEMTRLALEMSIISVKPVISKTSYTSLETFTSFVSSTAFFSRRITRSPALDMY